ncbi:MAG: hypothetical protein U0T79_05655 [Ferruginibacter sp.]
MRTWMIESLVVAVLLAATVLLKPFQWQELICGMAVLVTFMHAQVADRMQEKQAQQAKPDVHCYKWTARYFLLKESLWILFFVSIRSYAALAGSIVFFLYPFWRKLYNGRLRRNAIR